MADIVGRYAAKQLGIQFLIGFETEFLKSTNPVTVVDKHQWSTTAAVATGTVQAKVLEEIADGVQEDGIELQMYHAEAAPGQFEVIAGPMSPLEAADALVHTRETIYNIANKHGLRATYAPRLAPDSYGSGAHMHVSVHGERPGTSISEFLTPLESAFLAGLMDHLPSVIALTLPLPASCARMLDEICSGGTWVCWGVDNRVLACGIIRIRDELALTVQNCVTPRTAAEMSIAEKQTLGIRTRLASDDLIKDILGAELVEDFVQVNKILERRGNGIASCDASCRELLSSASGIITAFKPISQ